MIVNSVLSIFLSAASLLASPSLGEFSCDDVSQYHRIVVDGTVVESCQIDDGKGGYIDNGPYRISNEDGDVKVVGTMLSGQFHGKWMSFYPGGAVAVEGVYSHGNKIGLWVYRTEDGELDRTEVYHCN